MKKLLISIIVPVYKSELYIRDCIRSVQSQTYTNWELILVDDGSPDRSGAICDEYASIDDRIQVIHKENAGVAEARNTALNYVTGEYITFLDSDDDIPNNTLQLYIDEFQKSDDIDMVIGGFKRIYTENGEENFHHCSNPSVEYKQSNILKKLDDECCWNECLKASLIGNLRFQKEIRWNEDHLFNYDCITRAKAISFISDNVYNYYIRNVESLSNVKDPFVVISTCAKVCEYRLKMASSSEDNVFCEIIELKYINMFHFAIKLLHTPEYIKRIPEFRQQIPLKEILRKEISARVFLNQGLSDSVAFCSYSILRKLTLFKRLIFKR